MCLGVVSEALTLGETASHHVVKLCLRHQGKRCESLLGALRRVTQRVFYLSWALEIFVKDKVRGGGAAGTGNNLGPSLGVRSTKRKNSETVSYRPGRGALEGPHGLGCPWHTADSQDLPSKRMNDQICALLERPSPDRVNGVSEPVDLSNCKQNQAHVF